MTSFAPAAALPRVVPLDPTKHVNYTPGMLLGVDDFTQEFAYHQGRLRWLARDLLGFGTVWGLALSFAEGTDDVQVVVSPGVAISPCGELICVGPTQCAPLDRWLEEHSTDVIAHAAALPGPVRLYVVLCYRECLTDDVPIPGEPCRSTDELMAPSRVKDDFRLELRLDPPEQPDEDAIIDLVAWLRRIPLVSGPGTGLDDFAAAVRDAIHVASQLSPPASPPEGPPLLLGSPPTTLEIPADDLTEYLRIALRIWVTEGVPLLRLCGAGCECGCAGGCGCAGEAGRRDEPCDDAVLLGALDLELELPPTGGIRLAPAGWSLDESSRPFLLSTRLLQELALGESVALDLSSAAAGWPWSIEQPAPLAAVTPAAPIVAGGHVQADGTVDFAYGGLQVEKVTAGGDMFRLYGWSGASTPDKSVVTGTPVVSGAIGYALEIVSPGPGPGPGPDASVYVRVRRLDGKKGTATTATTGFVVQVTDFSGLA